VDVLILRDPRESRAKCSLTQLRGRPDVRFVDYHPERRLDASQRVFLTPDAPELSPADGSGRGLFLIDCSWRRVEKLWRTVDGDPLPRSLPKLLTGYPRRSKSFPDPAEGLASVEALYAAVAILERADPSLLDGYHWRDEFLEANPALASG